MTELNGALAKIEAQLKKNYETFCMYGELHAAKNTDEGSKKSHKNLDLARDTREVLSLITEIRDAVPVDLFTVIKNGELSPNDLGAVWGDWHKEIAFKAAKLLQTITED